MNARGFKTLQSLVVSAMLTSTLFASAPGGPVAAGAGPQSVPVALENALAGIRGSGWNGASVIAAPPESAVLPVAAVANIAVVANPPARPTLTPDEISKIDGLLGKVGHDQDLDPAATRLIGLTQGNEVLVVRQLSGRDQNETEKKHVHFFNRSKRDPGVILLIYKNGDVYHGFRTDTNFLYHGGYAADGSVRPLPPTDGDPEMAAEIRWWAQQMDALRASVASTP